MYAPMVRCDYPCREANSGNLDWPSLDLSFSTIFLPHQAFWTAKGASE